VSVLLVSERHDEPEKTDVVVLALRQLRPVVASGSRQPSRRRKHATHMTRLEENATGIDRSSKAPRDDGSSADSFERRWAHWQARGRAHDANTHRRMVALGVLACLGAVALVWNGW